MLGLSGTLPYAVFVYLCICVFVFLYLDVTDAGRDKQTTSEDRATQLLICEALSLATIQFNGYGYFENH